MGTGLLWDLMHQLPGVRDIKASKLLARKRPRLIPIADTEIEWPGSVSA